MKVFNFSNGFDNDDCNNLQSNLLQTSKKVNPTVDFKKLSFSEQCEIEVENGMCPDAFHEYFGG